MKTLKFLSMTVLLSTLIISCKKDEKEPHTHDETPATEYGAFTVKFENKVGAEPLVLDFNNYLNGTDTFKVSTFNYYISNVKITAADNSVYTETESYHLVKANEAGSLQFTLPKVPAKAYSSITFMIGVDSTRNVSGAQTGALDPTNGHFWTWNSGYIMAKLEGTSPQSTATGKIVMFHVGGFSGANSVLKTVTLPLTANAVVSKAKTPQVILKADLAEWFTLNSVSFSSLNTIHMPGVNAKKIADNYANMFSVSQIVN